MKKLIQYIRQRREIRTKLENLTDPTLITRMYLSQQIDELIPKLREFQNGLQQR